MSLQLEVSSSERAQARARRTMVDSKIAYDIACDTVASLDQRHGSEIGRLQSEYDRMRVELRGATRNANRARRDGQRAEYDYWAAKARRLNDNEMPLLLSQLGIRVDEIEQAHRVLQAARVNVAIRAGIAPAYQHDIKIVNQLKGAFSIYFGGIGIADGPGHAHYSFNLNCECSYRREPARHGPVSAWRR